VAALGCTLAVLAACSSTTTTRISSHAATPGPSATSHAAAHAYFADGRTYYAWVVAEQNGPRLTLELAHHLVNTATDKAATNYLTSHGVTLGPDGVPNDFIDVDLRTRKTEPVEAEPRITVNPQGAGPQVLTLDEFRSWLRDNPTRPAPAGGTAGYPGAPSVVGPLFAVKFRDDTIVAADQVFEP
jgi:hypothetical protein